MSRKFKTLNVKVIIASSVGVTALVALTLALSLQPFRDHLRKSYGFEQPEYYDALQADTDANRADVVELLAERDRRTAWLQEVSKPKPAAELSHGRIDSFREFIVPDGPRYEPPLSLADGAEIKKDLCHSQWGWLDRYLSLCKSVDQSARAAEHYAHDVEFYWIPRLQPMRP
jgi:hypothetical protein